MAPVYTWPFVVAAGVGFILALAVPEAVRLAQGAEAEMDSPYAYWIGYAMALAVVFGGMILLLSD